MYHGRSCINKGGDKSRWTTGGARGPASPMTSRTELGAGGGSALGRSRRWLRRQAAAPEGASMMVRGASDEDLIGDSGAIVQRRGHHLGALRFNGAEPGHLPEVQWPDFGSAPTDPRRRPIYTPPPPRTTTTSKVLSSISGDGGDDDDDGEEELVAT
uniref:Uncharacterized protein n=1 Tax=Oryza glumipatula TaxID=40148 RepID=A0A0D9Y735_9ORYZ